MRLEEIARARALDCDTIEIWFADEARIGQKNKITRRWAKRGTRPSAPRDQPTFLSSSLTCPATQSGLPELGWKTLADIWRADPPRPSSPTRLVWNRWAGAA